MYIIESYTIMFGSITDRNQASVIPSSEAMIECRRLKTLGLTVKCER